MVGCGRCRIGSMRRKNWGMMRLAAGLHPERSSAKGRLWRYGRDVADL